MGDSENDLQPRILRLIRETILIRDRFKFWTRCNASLSFGFVGYDLCLETVWAFYNVPVIVQDTAGVCAGASQRYG
jgi:hypothetical protein